MDFSINDSFQHAYPVQVLGDSYATRYMKFLEGCTVKSLQCIGGMGISGANIGQLKRALKHTNTASLPFCASIIIFIGTNDLLSSTPATVFKNQFLSLIKLLSKIFAKSQLIFVELPVFPRLQHNPSFTRSVEATNLFLRSLRSDRIAVVTLPPHLNNQQYFHAFYGKSKRRDGIHLNNLGYQELTPYIVSAIVQWHATQTQ